MGIKMTGTFSYQGERVIARLQGSGEAALAEVGSQIAKAASVYTYQTFKRQTGFAGSNWGFKMYGYGSSASMQVGSFNRPPGIENKYGVHERDNYVVYLEKGWHDRGGKAHPGGHMLERASDKYLPEIPQFWQKYWNTGAYDRPGRVQLTGQVAVDYGKEITVGDF